MMGGVRPRKGASQSSAKTAVASTIRSPKRKAAEDPPVASIAHVAKQFFDACEAGRGWAICHAYCTEDATFTAQSEPLVDVKSLESYTEWMKTLLGFMPDGRVQIESFAIDDERNCVCVFG